MKRDGLDYEHPNGEEIVSVVKKSEEGAEYDRRSL